MPARNNIHVPKESWPKFSWFLIEFAIVIAITVVIAWQTNPLYEDYVIMYGWAGAYTHLTLPTKA